MSARAATPVVLLVAVTAVWGYTFVPVQDAVGRYPLFAFLAVRFAISTAALAPFCATMRRSASTARGTRRSARRRPGKPGLRAESGSDPDQTRSRLGDSATAGGHRG